MNGAAQSGADTAKAVMATVSGSANVREGRARLLSPRRSCTWRREPVADRIREGLETICG